MDPNKAMDDFQTKKVEQLYWQAQQAPYDEFWKLRGQKVKLITIQMIGVAVSLVLQAICGLYKLLPSDILMWWILPLAVWCIVFFVLIARVQNKIDTLTLQLRNKIRSRRDDQRHNDQP